MSHSHYITARLSSCCHNNNHNQNQNNSKLKQRQNLIYQTVSIKMQEQLKSLQNRKNQQIQILLEQNRNLKIENSKLEIKFNISKQGQQKLKMVISQQEDKIQSLNNKLFSLEVSSLHYSNNVKEIVKQVVVKEPLNQYYQTKIQTLQKLSHELKSQKQSSLLQLNGLKLTIQVLNGKIEEIQNSLKSKQRHLKQIMEENRNLIYDMQQTKLINEKYHQQLKDLRQSDPIVIEKHKIKEIPVLVEQYQKETVQSLKSKSPIDTIYIDRPIQKIRLVQVNKFITQFVEPQRPMVTRIIDCGENQRNKSNCGCQN